MFGQANELSHAVEPGNCPQRAAPTIIQTNTGRYETMPQQMIWFFTSIAMSFAAWGLVTARYIWPRLRDRPRAEALQPLLMLHCFRFIGLAFIVPGVVSIDLPAGFAIPAAWRFDRSSICYRDSVAVAKDRRVCSGVGFQCLGLCRYSRCFLSGQSQRVTGGTIRRDFLSSDFDCAAAADYARSAIPNSY